LVEASNLYRTVVDLDHVTVAGGLTLHRELAYWVVQLQWEAERRPPLLCLTDDHRQRGIAWMREKGMPEGGWFACLHVRENGFHDETVDWSHNQHRNGHIQDYHSAIEAVTARGGWVVRIGNQTMTPLPEMPQVIDYAHSNEKRDWLDVFFMGAARLFFGTTSGPIRVCAAFGMPIALSNAFPLWNWPQSKNVVFSHKLLRRKSDGSVLGMADALSNPIFTQIFPTAFESHGIEVIENTSEEIREGVVELLDRLDGIMVYSDDDEKLQRDYVRATDRYGFGFSSRVARDFLARHPELVGSGLAFVESAEDERKQPSYGS
jgi:putative glycosyltransferase (TIGR04372 family)